MSIAVTIEGPPVPASRPRVSRWGTYYGKQYKAWRQMAEAWLANFEFPTLDGPVRAEIVIVCRRPQKPSKVFPRGDIDNYVKAALDAVVKWTPVLNDDDQVVRMRAVKRYAEKGETPRIDMWFEPCEWT